MLSFYNSLSRRKEKFNPIRKKVVHLYACGPTVYDDQHIGNFRTYIFDDILRRALEANGYKVKTVINITDVGHLVSDADSGEDKVQIAARKEKKTAWQVARAYEAKFKEDFRKLHLKPPSVWARATGHIKEQIALIKKLEKKGYTYLIPNEGLYFNTSKFKKYGELVSSSGLRGLKPGARVGVVKGKKHSTDFALWKLSPHGIKRDMEWVSPWGKGFPGWHIECSAMSIKHLGIPIDIHTGGIDHLPIHHTNEIAQSEAATGKKFVNYWIHGEHLLVNGQKMSKSLKNFYTLDDLVKKGFNLSAFRYLILSSHYRSRINFTWMSLESAESGLGALYRETAKLGLEAKPRVPALKSQDLKTVKYKDAFNRAIEDDLNTPRAIAVLWDLIGDRGIWPKNKLQLLLKFDEVLGLRLKEAIGLSHPPVKVASLVKKREEHRTRKQFVQADRLRKKIEALGYTIEDTPQGPFLWPQKI